MPRTKLREQPRYEFTYQFCVQSRDLSSRRHLGADAIVQLMHEAVVHLLHALSLHEFDLGDGRTGIIAEDTIINYMREAFLFEPLAIESHVDEVSFSGFRVFHRMIRSGETIALAECGVVGFDLTGRAPVPIPETFKKALLQHHNSP